MRNIASLLMQNYQKSIQIINFLREATGRSKLEGTRDQENDSTKEKNLQIIFHHKLL